MEYDMKIAEQLAEELVNLWVETKMHCEKIERLIKQIKKESSK